MARPERREREVTVVQKYWFCGIDGDGHYHGSELSALRCIKSRGIPESRTDEQLNPRLSLALSMRRSGSTYKAIGDELGVCLNRARDIVKKAEKLVATQFWAQKL